MSYKFKNLVFEGGGVKGIAYGGALERISELGYLSEIVRVAGTSAGAINATLLALGFSAEEVSRLIAQTNFEQFADDDWGVIRDINRLLDDYGWHKGRKFEKWMGRRIAERSGKSSLTFAELQALKELNPSIRDLYVVGTNLSDQEVEYYSHETTPNMEIRKAVRISMSIPLYFQCVRNEFDEVLVDGGVIRNYPINLFDNVRYLINPENGQEETYNQTPGFIFNHETLGFRLDDKGLEEGSLFTGNSIPADIGNIYEYAKALVGFMRQMACRLHLHSNDWGRTIHLDTTGVGVTDFDLSDDQIQELLDNGRAGVDRHFDWREGDEGENRPL